MSVEQPCTTSVTARITPDLGSTGLYFYLDFIDPNTKVPIKKDLGLVLYLHAIGEDEKCLIEPLNPGIYYISPRARYELYATDSNVLVAVIYAVPKYTFIVKPQTDL
jgi:hypothetical protein